ncbi:dnaJ homolog subfamily C member 24 isoform 1-T1 [Geothlypis trichas]
MPSVHTVTLVPLVALLPFQWDNQTGRFLLCPAPSPPFLWLLSLALLLSCVLLAEYEMQDGWLLSQPAHPQPPKPFCAVVFGWQYHPDKQAAGAAAEERTRQFLEIHQAWKVLGNEETKQEYDLQQREDNLTKEWPLHEQIYLEDMSWNEDEQLYTLSCRCGGNYSVSKSETPDVSLVCCDTCSLVIQILQ